ncbi:MAG: DUF1289 domain-containing protein [Gammaproteobacteria bacterium]|nr:DUF1289 domain-containing protein [Gammaproteobacteria bacterium]
MVRSPCRSTCKLNEDDVCIGCFRHMQDIANWNKMSDRARHIAIIRTQKRRLARPYEEQDLNQVSPVDSLKHRQYKQQND